MNENSFMIGSKCNPVTPVKQENKGEKKLIKTNPKP